MNKIINKSIESKISSFKKEDISDSTLKVLSIKNYMHEKLFNNYKGFEKKQGVSLENKTFTEYTKDFREYITKYLENKKIDKNSIQKVGYKDSILYIEVNGKKDIQINMNDFHRDLFVGKLNVKKSETNIKVIHIAMQSIFNDNNGIFDELDHSDRFSVQKAKNFLKKGKIKNTLGISENKLMQLLAPFEGENLQALRGKLDNEQKSLIKYYDIIGNSEKSLILLSSQLEYYAGIGDLYEGGARYFGLKSTEIESMTEQIASHKNSDELIAYIVHVNKQIHENGKISDMAKEKNKKVIENLSLKTFKKLKQEKASNATFLKFIRTITGREMDNSDTGVFGSIKDFVIGGKVEVDRDMEQTKTANEALIYLMYNRNIVSKINKSHKINLTDKVFGKETKNFKKVNNVMGFAINNFKKIGVDTTELFKKLGIDKLKDIEIGKLKFEQLLIVLSLHNLTKIISENISELKGKTKAEINNFLHIKNTKALEDSFSTMNENLEKNFEATWDDWNGVNSDELQLTGAEAEVFNLYGKINGRGAFELSDDNFFSKTFLSSTTGVVMAVGIITASIVLSPAIMAGGLGGLLIAGAQIGLTTTIASQLIGKKGYDTNKEAAVGITVQTSIDVASSALFTAGSGWLISKIGGSAFANTLTSELKTGRLTGPTIEKLDDIFKEGNRALINSSKGVKAPSQYWQPQLKKALEEVDLLNQIRNSNGVDLSKALSPETVKFLGRYSAVNGTKGNIADIFIGIGDGIAGSLAWQVAEFGLRFGFSENHYNADAGETFDTVEDLRASVKSDKSITDYMTEAKNYILESNKKDTDLSKQYHTLTQNEKKELTASLVYCLNKGLIS